MNDANDHDQNHDQNRGDVFVADPSDVDYFDEPELPKWPKVVGIVSIVLGGFLTLCGALIPAQGWLNSQFLGGLEGGAPDVLLNPPVMNYVVGGIGVVAAILLLTAGIMCVLRNPASRKVFLLYAVLAIGSAIWSMMIQLDVQAQSEQWMQQNPDAQFTLQQQQVGSVGMFIGLGCTAILGLVWPAFCLFWFGFIKTKPEHFTDGANTEVL